MTRAGTATTALALAIGVVASCAPIESRPLSDAPINACPCEGYEPGATTAARCREGRCEVSTAGNRPAFPFWIVVHVPETSIFAPGSTYVLYSDERGEPAFKTPVTTGASTRCAPPLCLQLGGLSLATGKYQVSAEQSLLAGYPLADDASIPARVVYQPVGNEQQAEFPALPLDATFVPPRLGAGNVAEFAGAIPFGVYRRILYPLPPFDRFFPPTVEEPQTIASANFIDTFVLGRTKLLDDPTGESRVATVTRGDGLDGWRVWLVDRPSQRRISTLRTLSGSDVTVRLDTAGEQRTESGGLGDDVEVIVAPPESWTAVPRLVSQLFGGQGLKSLVYPTIPTPVTVAGVVAQPGEGPQLFGYPARVSFESTTLATRGEPSSLLHYETNLNTDDRGRFATVLPPGTYSVTVEPAEGTGFAKSRQSVLVDRAVTALTLQPPPRSRVRGRVVLTDGRTLGEATILATARTVPSSPGVQVVTPRPGRGVTLDDGRFELALDPGSYVLTVVPKAGTGFPRVVVRPDVPAVGADLPDIRVPAPTSLSFTLRDPSPTANPIGRAIVRIFAIPAGERAGRVEPPEPVEIGSAMTDPRGLVEILLAQEPR